MSSRPALRLVVTDSFDWSGTGRGKHVEFGRDERLPLEIGRRLGRGSTSDVHETTCRGLAVAVKQRYLARAIPDSAPFKKEMSNLERVSGHDHIVKIIGSFVHNRVIGVLLWPVAICDLGTLLDDLEALNTFRKLTSLPHSKFVKEVGVDGFKRTVSLGIVASSGPDAQLYQVTIRGIRLIDQAFGCLTGALAYIHGQKIKHKDLKPSNILLTSDNIYITDFGTSTDLSDYTGSVTETGIRGSPRYFAPEVAEYQPSGRSADVFSLGCIFLEMMYVRCKISAQILRDLLPYRDHSYHANLELSAKWTDALLYRSWLLRGDYRLPAWINSMLQRDGKSRPSALDVFNQVRAIDPYSGSAPAFCGECCRDMEILV